MMFKLRPSVPRVEPEISVVAVEALKIALVDHPVQVPSQGAFEPLTETKLAAEVGGRIVAVAPGLEAGGQFAEGEVMLEIDPTQLRRRGGPGREHAGRGPTGAGQRAGTGGPGEARLGVDWHRTKSRTTSSNGSRSWPVRRPGSARPRPDWTRRGTISN